MFAPAKVLIPAFIAVCLSACGGGGGGGGATGGSPTSGAGVTPPVDSNAILQVTFNPAQAIQTVYQYAGTRNDATYRYLYAQERAETIEGVTYNVQSILRVDAAGKSENFKRYYLVNPFRIFTPKYSYLPPAVGSFLYTTVYNTLSYGTLPTAARIGDFGVFETSSARACDNFSVGSCTTLAEIKSTWTLEKADASTAQLCFGATNEPRLTSKVCYRLDSASGVVW